MKKFLWIVTIISSLIGGFIALGGILMAKSSPQEASAAAIGLACAIIPYCISRAASEVGKS